jgi:hypothetical protein
LGSASTSSDPFQRWLPAGVALELGDSFSPGVGVGVLVGADAVDDVEAEDVGTAAGPPAVSLSSPELAKIGTSVAIRAVAIDAAAAIHALLWCLSNQLFVSGFSSTNALITPLARPSVEASSP